MLCSINKFSQLILLEILGDQVGEFVCGYCLKELNIPWTCKSCEQKAKLSIILWVFVKWHLCKMDAVSFTLFSPRYLTWTLHIYPAGYCGFQVTGKIEWGQKSKPNIWPFVQYFICRTVRLGYAGTTTNLRIVLSTPKKSLPESKILNPQKSFDHPRLLKSGVPSMVIYIILQVQEIKLKVAKLRALAICQNRMARPILLYREFHCLGKKDQSVPDLQIDFPYFLY